MQEYPGSAVERGCVGEVPDKSAGDARHTGFDLTAQAQSGRRRITMSGLLALPAAAVQGRCARRDGAALPAPLIEASEAVLTVEYRLQYRDDPGGFASFRASADLQQTGARGLPPTPDHRFCLRGI
ncbi:hypothetical protein Q4485_14640 [Granulosicoccaceae sp. 1_MG-2023]|nr:hypothetical protein [Granulosicoccaceae sp. 1_MG-2023]